MTKFELISCTVSIVSSIFVLIGLVYAGIQLHLTRIANENIHEWNRRKTTYDLLKDFSSGNFSKILMDLRAMTHMRIDETTNYEIVIKNLSEEKQYDFEKKLNQLLNYFEGIAISIKNHIVDEDICYDYAALIYQRYYIWSCDFIKMRRKDIGDQSLYIDFENISLKWIDLLKKENEQVKNGLYKRGKIILK